MLTPCSFLEAWKSGDYPTSFDYLYRYFDYTTQVRDRHFYQYALMNSAILYADFGCHKEAMDAMIETIATARENRDMTCLNFTLNWLFHFGKAHPHLVKDIESNHMLGDGKESLSYLHQRARETGMWVLASSSLLSEAKVGLSSGDSVATCVENMVRSSHNIVEHNVTVMLGSQLSMSMILWERLGLTNLATMVCEVFLRHHAQASVFEDEVKVKCRLAGQLANKGRYNSAFNTLETLDPDMLRAWKANQYYKKYRGLLKLRRDLHRSALDSAEHLLAQLQQTSQDDVEPDLPFVVDTLHIEIQLRRGDLEAAQASVDRLLAAMKDDNKDVAMRVRLLLLKAHVFDLAGRPQRGFSLAMRAATLAWRARLLRLLWQAVGALANVLTSLGEFSAAADLLIAVLPRALECEGAFLNGTLYSLLADARMGQAGQQQIAGAGGRLRAGGGGKKKNKRAEYMQKACEVLDLAFDQFRAVEDVEKQCEVLAKKATILRVLGDYPLADSCAAQFLVLRREVDMRNC
jgi:anaphase-promoting complex subunit 5